MNKKSIFIGIIFIAAMLIAVFNVNIRGDKTRLTDVSLDNIDALAQEGADTRCINVKGFCQTPEITTDRLSFE